jgi:hypothetical protein
MVGNNKTISTLAASPSEGLQDGTDSIHSGVIKGLESFAYNRCIINHNGFTISAPGGSTLNTVTLLANSTYPIQYIFDGKFTQLETGLTVSTVAPHGTYTRYDWVVLNTATNALNIIQGNEASTPKVSDFNSDASGDDKYIPVALILMAGGSANGVARDFQMYTLEKNDLSLTVADDAASSGQLVEAMSITSASGVTTFENKVSNADMIFKVNDGGTPTEVMRIDGTNSRVGIGTAGNEDSTLHIQGTTTGTLVKLEAYEGGTDAAPDLVLYRNMNHSGTGGSDSSADLDYIGEIIFTGLDSANNDANYSSLKGRIQDNNNTAEAGGIYLQVLHQGANKVPIYCAGHTTGTGLVTVNYSNADIDFRCKSADGSSIFAVDASALSNAGAVGIDTTSPTTSLDVNGSFSTIVTTITGSTASYTVVAADFTIIGHSIASPLVITLPACSDFPGRVLHIHQLDSGSIRLAPDGSDTVSGFMTASGGGANTASNVFLAQYQGCTLVSDGVSSWCMVGQSGPMQ